MHKPMTEISSDRHDGFQSAVAQGEDSPVSERTAPDKRRVAIGPDGRPLRLEDLPPPDTQRWVMRRKAIVVAGVRAGLISLEQACERYNLSAEEFQSWQRLIERHGVRGLRTTRLQQYRNRDVSLSSTA